MSANNSEETNENGTQTAEAKRKSRVPMYVVGSLLIVAAIGGLIYWLYVRQFESTDDAFIEADIVQISPKISSHVKKIHVRENQEVKKGDLLIELDADEFSAKVEQAKSKLLAAQALRTRAAANVALTRKSAKADLNQANSNLDTAQTSVNQAKLSTNSRESAITQARNQVRTAESELRQSQSRIKAAEATLEQSQLQIPKVQANFDVARTEYERNLILFEGGDVSKQTVEKSRAEMSEAKAALEVAKKQIDIARSDLDSLRFQVEAARSRLNEVRSGVAIAENEFRQSQSQVDTANSRLNESFGRVQAADTLPEKVAVEESEIGNADAQIAQAEAELRQAELELSYTKLYAPGDGFVAKKNVQEGQLVQADQALLAITQKDIWLIANFKETQISSIAPGQSVDVYVDAYPNILFRGRVDSIQAGTGSRFSVLPPENASGNFVKVVQRIPIKITIEESPDKIKLIPGMSAVPRVKIK
jgi:membrane fusion protein (multidrug efflux system)